MVFAHEDTFYINILNICIFGRITYYLYLRVFVSALTFPNSFYISNMETLEKGGYPEGGIRPLSNDVMAGMGIDNTEVGVRDRRGGDPGGGVL